MRNVIRVFKTPFLSVTESSAGFYLLLSFILHLQLLQKTLSEITLSFIQELLCVRLQVGNLRRPPVGSAFAGSLVLLFAKASQGSAQILSAQ